MSAQHSLPPASISIAWVNTFPRSMITSRSPVLVIAADSASPKPSRSPKQPKACSPT